MSEEAAEPAAAEEKPYTTTPADSDPKTRWPNGQPVKGHIYGFVCPVTKVMMVAMTAESWTAIDASFRTMKQANLSMQFDLQNLRQHALAGEDKKIIDLSAQDVRQR